MDDYNKVHKKLIKCEITSDIQSDSEQPLTRRKHFLPQRYIDSEDEEPQTSSQLSRPPKVRRLNLLSADDGQEKFQQNGTLMAVTRNRNLTQINESSPQTFNCDTPKSTASRTLHSLNISEDLIHRLISIQESCLTAVTHVKEQNKQILNYLTQQKEKQSSPFPVLPELPTQLPINSEQDLIGLNTLLTESPDTNSALCTYLRTLGGKDITNKTNRILKYILTDEVTQNYNYFGKRSKKKAFCELQLNDVIIRAVKADCVNSHKYWHRNDALYQAVSTTTTTPKPTPI
ncbi:hypothetical protein RN001_001690 [Aquatica leii]|uniref:DUF4806 domain-containing protein n=1 Tax=Aquatica leii TaxID=1421715 RepID=A0AAN7SLG2_9COLE|nr:hypothetical protein RN001_001690 [Aquatica leii]